MTSPAPLPPPSPSALASSDARAPAQTRYAPDLEALAVEDRIQNADVLAVIDARGGDAYFASVETGLANRWPFIDAADRKRAVERALASGTIVQTPMGRLRRPPRDDG